MFIEIKTENAGTPLTYGELHRILEVSIAIDPSLEGETARVEIEGDDGDISINHILSVIMSNTDTRIVGRQPNDSKSRS